MGLAFAGWLRGTGWWVAVNAGVMGCVVAMKAAVAAFGPVAGIYSPSGHTAMAAIMAGGIWSLASKGRHARVRRLAPALLATLVVAALVGVSRVWLGDHTWPDVLVALPVGLAGAALLLHAAGTAPRNVRTWPAAVAALAVIAVLHGNHLSAEQSIAALAGHGGERPSRAPSTGAG